ncbi:Long-chain-fatty-acid CoA ligase [Entamoeba marina]
MADIYSNPDNYHVHKEGELVYVDCKEKFHIHRTGKESFETYTNSTSYELFERRCLAYPKADVLGYKVKGTNGKYDNNSPFLWYSGEQALNKANAISCGIKSYFKVKKGDMVGIFVPNRAEWVIVAEALHRIGVIPVPLYATLGIESINYIIRTTNISLIIVTSETIAKADELDPAEPESELKFMYLDPQVPFNAKRHEVKSVDEIIEIGNQNPSDKDLPKPDDIYAVFFTSGTSGVPKGVVHSYRSFHSACLCFNSLNIFDKENVCLNRTTYSYLPLAHVFEHEVCFFFVYGYGRVAFNCGGLGCLLSEIQECQPDHLIAVPRVLQRVKMAMDAYIASSNFVSRIITPPSTLLGKKLKSIINGSAPLTKQLYDYLRTNLPNTHVLQGYGSTETFGGICCNTPGLHDPEILSIGSPMLNGQFRIRSVPDLGYLTSNEPPTGELEIKSTNNFICYYKNPDLTSASYTDDNFFMTGDIVRLNTDGSVSIIDRKSNLIKLAQGEFVAVEAVESSLIGPMIAQAFVHGVSTDSFVVAVIVPTAEGAKLSEHELFDVVVSELTKKSFPSFSIPKAIYIEHTPFSEDNDLLTPSMKLRRANLKKKYVAEVDQLRAKVNKN